MRYSPLQLYHRLKYFGWEHLHPDAPWLCPGTVRFLERHLTHRMRAFEFGSGRSTCWLARRVGHLVSVEHNAGWYSRVRQELARQGLAVDYRLIPLNHPEAEPERTSYDPLPYYVAALADQPVGSFDFVLVDGHYRTNCIRAAIPKLAPGALLAVDDVNLWAARDRLPVPLTWTAEDESTNGLKRAIIWRAP